MQELLHQFEEQFETPEDCYSFLLQIKWPGGFECPRCSHRQCYVIATRKLPLYECRDCRYQASLISGTVMEKSRTSLRKWLLALYLFTHPSIDGLNAVRLAECLKVTYKTAWSMLHKIRQAVSQFDDAKPLDGKVDVIVTPYCRPLLGSLEPHPKESPVIVGANLNEASNEASVIKMKIAERSMLRATNACFLFPQGEQWFTSCHSSETASVTYIRKPIDYRPQTIVLRQLAKQAQKWMARLYRGISGPHLQSYLDEFCFRYNSRSPKHNQNESSFHHLCAASLLHSRKIS
ncbi:transposase [Paenibacillus thailandensis]|uniref:Transposase n=1 Tax=Paenibacillus thailandensis TaxID=393250 RepID=A0ABW5R215_9BACL